MQEGGGPVVFDEKVHVHREKQQSLAHALKQFFAPMAHLMRNVDAKCTKQDASAYDHYGGIPDANVWLAQPMHQQYPASPGHAEARQQSHIMNQAVLHHQVVRLRPTSH